MKWQLDTGTFTFSKGYGLAATRGIYPIYRDWLHAEGTQASFDGRAQIVSSGKLARALRQPRSENSRYLNGRGQTAVPGTNARTSMLLRPCTWTYCGGRGHKAVHRTGARAPLLQRQGIWAYCSGRERKVARGMTTRPMALSCPGRSMCRSGYA